MKKKGRLVDMKKLIVILFIIFGAFLTFSLYRTFAYDTSVVEEVPSTTDLEYTFKIGNSSIKQITVDSGETRYYDIVLGNPNNAKISYSVYYEMISPSTKPDDYKIEYTSKSTGNSTGIVGNNGNITLNIVVTNTSSSAVTVKLGTVTGYVKGGELTLNSGQAVIPRQPVDAVELITNLNDNTTGDSGSGVYKVTHSAITASSSATGSEIPVVTDYRYYGSNPNNYICLDMEGQSTCPDKHLYRIIGSIYEELEDANRLKVIKATPLTDGTTSAFSWDYTSSGSYNNIWATPTNGNYSNSLTNGSQLMKLLNSGAWWNGTSDSYYNGSATPVTVNFTNYKLSDRAKGYIGTSRYYLGGYNTGNVTTLAMYGYERGTNRIDNNRPLYWDGYVGLMYPSDYGYAAGKSCGNGTNLYNYDVSCKSNDWLYNSSNRQWLMSPASYNSDGVWYVTSSGDVNYDINARRSALVVPVFYLTSSTYITDGDGSISNPYKIVLGIDPYIEVKPEYKDGLKKVFDGRPLTIENPKNVFNYYPKNATISCDGSQTDVGPNIAHCTLTCNYNGNIIEKFSNIEINVLPKKPTLD